MLSTLRTVAVRAARPSGLVARRVIGMKAARCFSSAIAKLQQGIQSELQFEKENYSKPEALAKLPKEWKLNDKPGDVNLKIEKDLGNGKTYYYNTQQGEGHRFIIGSVKTWTSVEERDSMSAYNGPDFEDLDNSLQESMDEYLAEIGITDEIYDFIDSSAVDKELREYMRWLENLKEFMTV